MKFTHKGLEYEVDDEIDCVQGLDPEMLQLDSPFTALGTEVPAEFRWNGGSGPNSPLARFISPKFYRNIKASCLHDFLCELAGKDKVKRQDADVKYFIMLRYVEKVPVWKCKLGYYGVRVGYYLGIGTTPRK